MKTIHTLTLLVFLFTGMNTFAQDTAELIADANEVKATYLSEDPEMASFFNDSEAYVIFPNIGKAGFIIGASSGNGVVFKDGEVVGLADVKKLDVGLQAGGKVFSQIIFFENPASFLEFKRDQFQLTGNLSAVMLKSGAAAQAEYRDGVAVFAKPKEGLMADLSVGGQKFEYTPLSQ